MLVVKDGFSVEAEVSTIEVRVLGSLLFAWGISGGCGKGDIGFLVLTTEAEGIVGTLLYKFPLGFRIPISPNLFLIQSTHSSMVSLELQENRMATVSKLTTNVHSWSPAGTRLGEMC